MLSGPWHKFCLRFPHPFYYLLSWIKIKRIHLWIILENTCIQGKNYKLKREKHHYWNVAIKKQISLHLLKVQNIAFIYLFIHPFFAGESVLGYTARGLFLTPHGRISFSAYTSLLASALHSCTMTLCTMCFVWKTFLQMWKHIRS